MGSHGAVEARPRAALGLERHDTQRGAHLGRRHRTWLLRQTPLVDLIRRLRTKDDTRREKKSTPKKNN
jgi:hypothetical protein